MDIDVPMIVAQRKKSQKKMNMSSKTLDMSESPRFPLLQFPRIYKHLQIWVKVRVITLGQEIFPEEKYPERVT
jgi:hypothetical protein